MIIRTPRSRLHFVIDVFVTLVAWVALLYFLGMGMLSILQGQRSGPEVTLLVERLLPSAGTVGAYMLVAAFNAAVLLLWAKYNEWRFRGKERRTASPLLDDEQLAKSFGIDLPERLRSSRARRMTVHHDSEGNIRNIEINDAVEMPRTKVESAPYA